MKTTILKTNKLLIAISMVFFMGTKGYCQIPIDPLPDTLKLCDAYFKDMLPLILLPANTDMSNLVALAPRSNPIGIYNYYYWDMGDGTKDTGNFVLHNYAKPGKYLVTLKSVVVVNTFMGFREHSCNHTEWVTAGIIEPEKTCDASFHPMILATTDYPSSYSSVVGYEAQNKTFKSYHWDFGDGTTDTGRSVQHYFVNEGKYLVSLTVKDENCEDTKTMWMTKRGYYFPIDSTTKCNSNLRTFINDNSVRFYDQPIQTLVAIEPDGNYETWNWEFGDGQSAVGNYMTHTYGKAGKYVATLTKSSFFNPCFNSGSPFTCYAQPILKCTQTYQIEVMIGEPVSNCKAELSHNVTDKTLEIRDNVVYVNTTFMIPTIYERRHWDFGDGSDTVSNNLVTHTYANAGKYRIRLIKSILNDPCPFVNDTLPRCLAMPFLICMDTTYLDIEVGNEYPTCKAKLAHTIRGATVEISDQLVYVSKNASIIDPISEYTAWDFGDGSTTFLNSAYSNGKVSYTYANPGKYRIRLIKSITNNPCGFVSDTLVRCLAPVTLICTDTTYLDIEVGNEYPTCKAKLAHTISGAIVEISDQLVYVSKNASIIDPISEYTAWDFGDGSTTFLNSAYSKGKVSHTYANTGKYRIRLIKSLVKDPCPFINDTLLRCKVAALLICMDTTYLDVEIGNRHFTCDAKLEYVITENALEIKDNNILSTRGGYREYRKWDFGDESGDTLSNDLITHSYAKAGKYSIILIKSIIQFGVPDTNDTFIHLGLPIVHCTDTTYLDVEIGNSIVASIYPNPASDYMTISVKNNLNKMDLRLYDQTGKLKKEVFEIQSNTKEIDTEGLDNGLYFYTLSDGENVVLKGKIAVSK